MAVNEVEIKRMRNDLTEFCNQQACKGCNTCVVRKECRDIYSGECANGFQNRNLYPDSTIVSLS